MYVLWGRWLLIFWMLTMYVWSILYVSFPLFLSSSTLQTQVFLIKAIFALIIRLFAFENQRVSVHIIAVSSGDYLNTPSQKKFLTLIKCRYTFGGPVLMKLLKHRKITWRKEEDTIWIGLSLLKCEPKWLSNDFSSELWFFLFVCFGFFLFLFLFFCLF